MRRSEARVNAKSKAKVKARANPINVLDGEQAAVVLSGGNPRIV